jgi:hypothetical protein
VQLGGRVEHQLVHLPVLERGARVLEPGDAQAAGAHRSDQPVGGRATAPAPFTGRSRRFARSFIRRAQTGGVNSRTRSGREVLVELLIIVGALCGLGLLAVRYGADSREAVRSEEHDLARRGLVWGPAPVPACAPARRRRRGA